MSTIARRKFLAQAAASAAGAMAAAYAVPAIAQPGANDRIRVGVIGCQRGLTLAKEFVAQGQQVVSVCDPDEARAAKLKKLVKADEAFADMRKILDDKSIDAVAVAAPDHWHATAAIHACEAGKHVYVEKPCSHNIREGRLMIEAARRSKRVMQVGSQSRSTTALKNGVRLLHEGAIGEILIGKAWTTQRRVNIGHEQPSDPPEGFDYDQWVGPAPMCPFQKNRYHYTWHWWYNFGTGDAGNRGVHEMDIALWGMGLTRPPAKVSGHGSKLYFDDDQQFPDTHYATFEFPAEGKVGRRLIVYEQRIWSPYDQETHTDANAFYGTEGYMILSKHSGWKLYGPKNVLLKEESGVYSVPEHVADFLDAMRTGKRPNADIDIGHVSAIMAHLANIQARIGRTIVFDPKTEHVVGDPEADALTSRTYREGHWGALKIGSSQGSQAS